MQFFFKPLSFKLFIVEALNPMPCFADFSVKIKQFKDQSQGFVHKKADCVNSPLKSLITMVGMKLPTRSHALKG